MTYEEDASCFIDQFQQFKADGHIHFYRELELDALFSEKGFVRETQFFSAISYPREASETCLHLIDKTPETILEKYRIGIREGMVYVTVTVMNVLYRKI